MSDPTSPYGDYPPAPGQPPYGQPQPGQQPYGQQPYGQPPYGGGPLVAPPPVRNAVTLMFVRAGLGVLSLLALFATSGALRDQLAVADASLTASELDGAVGFVLTVGAVFGLVFIALYVALALQVRKGKSWARTVTLVLAGLAVVTALLSLGQEAPLLTRLLGLVLLAVDIAILYLLTRRQSSEFFRRPV